MNAESRKKIALVDYGLGNIFSVRQALQKVGADVEITRDSSTILNADAVVLPGVGAFAEGMKNLKSFGLDKPLLQAITEGKSFFGICLGLQLLFEGSEEHGQVAGLGLLKGTVKKFPSMQNGLKLRVPQIAWNTLRNGRADWSKSPLNTLEEGVYMYFVHSYFVEPADAKLVLSETDYQGVKYCSSVQCGNIFATQFHPEKSAAPGLDIYKNWLQSLNHKK